MKISTLLRDNVSKLVSVYQTKSHEAIFKGLGVGYARAFAAVPIYLILTPYVLSKIGEELFGLWALNSAITAVFMMQDFGFKNSLVHFTAKNLDNDAKVSDYFRATLYFYISVSTLCCLLAFVFCDTIIITILKIPSQLFTEARWMLYSSVIGISIRLLACTYESVIEGHQRVHIIQLVYIVWMLFNFGATIAGLWIFPSILTLSLVYVAGNLLIFIMLYAHANKLFQCGVFSVRRLKFSVYKEILPYSSWIQVSSILILLREPVIKFVLIRTQGLADLAQFEIAYRLTLQAMSFAIIPLLTAFSVAAKLHDKPDELKAKIKLFNIMVFCILAPAVLAVFMLSDNFVHLWLGEQQSLVAPFLKYIFLAYSLYYIAEPMYKVLSGVGKSFLAAMLQLVYLSTFIICCLYIDKAPTIYALIVASIVYTTTTYISFRRCMW